MEFEKTNYDTLVQIIAKALEASQIEEVPMFSFSNNHNSREHGIYCPNCETFYNSIYHTGLIENKSYLVAPCKKC